MNAPGEAAPWLAVLLAGCAALGAARMPEGPFVDSFERAPGPPGPAWVVTSGDLRVEEGAGRTASPVFRAVTRRGDFRDAEVRFKLLNHGLSESPATPKTDWDGVHVFLRYQSQFHLYYASVNRRDGTAVIKKKTPGGPSNGGSYHDLCRYEKHPVPYGAWQDIRVVIKDVPEGVRIEAYADGALIAAAVDEGRTEPAIRAPGRVGVRADNADIELDDFSAEPLPAAPSSAASPGGGPPPSRRGARSYER
jgi:hypothetical protein